MAANDERESEDEQWLLARTRARPLTDDEIHVIREVLSEWSLEKRMEKIRKAKRAKRNVIVGWVFSGTAIVVSVISVLVNVFK